MLKELRPAVVMVVGMTLLTGLVYPLAVTGVAQAVFPHQAHGSLVEINGQIVGSSLIGQNFTKPDYFQSRPSAAGNDGYDASSSLGSNWGSTNQKLIDRVKASVDKFHKDNPEYSEPIPADLVTASSSGLDPHISPASAEAQAPRIAKTRGIAVDQVLRLITEHTEARTLGVLGEPRVNVLELNLDLDRQFPHK